MTKRKLLVIVLCIVLSVLHCSNKKELIKHQFFRLDTIIDVIIVTDAKADSIWQGIDSLLEDWEVTYSISGPESVIGNINNRKHDTIQVSKQLGEMLSLASRYGDSLSGGFDFTILPLKEIWGLSETSPDSMPAPSRIQIDSVLNLVGYKNVRVTCTDNIGFTDTLIFSSRDTRIDIGGVAKGFALREIARFLDRKNLCAYLINGGGDIIGKGRKPDGSSWVIGIQHPRKPGVVHAVFNLDSGSVFTSGDYERFRMIDSVRVHHLFDPHTGYSATINQSVTICGPDPIENKFLSTGLFYRDADSIISYINIRPRLKCMVVDSIGKIYLSQNWKDKLEIQK